jgi:hypothetical protein
MSGITYLDAARFSNGCLAGEEKEKRRKGEEEMRRLS